MNGMLERSHQVLKKTLDKLGTTVKDWDDYLPQTLLALRTAPHAVLGLSPFHLLFGREARTTVSVLRENWEAMEKAPKSVIQYMEDLYQQAELTQKMVTEADTLAKEKSKAYYDQKAVHDPLKEGEMVLLMTPKGVDSLTCKWDGPYRIQKRLSDTTYLVDAPKGSGGGQGRRNLMLPPDDVRYYHDGH